MKLKTSEAVYYVGSSGLTRSGAMRAGSSGVLSSNTSDAHQRRLEMVRAEVFETIARQRLLSYLQYESDAAPPSKMSKINTEKPEVTSEKVPAKEPKIISAFPPEDEGVDFSWIYNNNTTTDLQLGLGRLEDEVHLRSDCTGIELVMEPFGFPEKSSKPVVEEANTDIVQGATGLKKLLFPVKVDVGSSSKMMNYRDDRSQASSEEDPSIIYASDSDSDSISVTFFDDDF